MTEKQNRNRFLNLGRPRVRRRVASILCAVLASLAAAAGAPEGQKTPEDAMKTHYEAAQKAQAAGQLLQAEVEYKEFVSTALRRLANRRAAAEELARAIALLEDSLALTPNDTELRLEFAQACRSSGDLPKAKGAAENVLTLEPGNAKAHLELGVVLSQMGEDAAATSQLEAAVAIDPNFANGYALAKEYLKRKDPEHAAKIFAEMQAGLGDSPELHMEFGSAYAAMGYPERGIPEFEKALAKNENIRGGHYSLGAAYLLGLGNVMQDKAQAEFQKELKNYPDDPLSLYQLGSIEFNRHQLNAAERDLIRAGKLDERNPDTFLLLGQIYNETGRTPDAEAALRKSISLTTDVSKNNYQVQRAHYLLARILMQSGRGEEAKREMQTANELQKQSTAAMQGLASAPDEAGSPSLPKLSLPLDPGKKSEADAFEQKIRGAVADSYNNLGAMAANAGDFAPALRYFQEAAKWNQSLEGLDCNWGRAAFSVRDYQQAMGPLGRCIEEHPDDTWVRAALGSSYFSLQKYLEAVKTLQSMAELLAGRPQLNYIYAVSQVKSGDTSAGVKRLEDLEKANPDIAAIAEALADAYASLGEKEKAAREREIAKTLKGKQAGPAAPLKPD